MHARGIEQRQQPVHLGRHRGRGVRRRRHGDPPEAGRDRGLHDLRARRDRRRRLARQHLPGRRPATCPPTSTRSRSRPATTGRGASRRRPRSSTTWRRSSRDYGIEPHLRLGTEAESASFDEASGPLDPATDRRRGARVRRAGHRLRAAHQPGDPGDPGHRGVRRARASTPPEWDHEHDLSGERVAVIGTGASAIQFVPRIAPEVGPADDLPALGAVDRPQERPRVRGPGSGDLFRALPAAGGGRPACQRGLVRARHLHVHRQPVAGAGRRPLLGPQPPQGPRATPS